MKKLAAASILIVLLIAGCDLICEGWQGISVTATQPTAWEYSITATQPAVWEQSSDYLEYVIDLGMPNETSENMVVYFDVSGTALTRDDIDGNPYLKQGYVEIPPGSQSASIKIDGITSNGVIEETQFLTITITGCSCDLPLGSQSEATAIIMDGDGEIVRDIDRNRYHTVKIGEQIWMVENLKTRKFRNGQTIEECWAYKGDYSKCDNCGMLYTWYVVMDIRGLAPEGWHVPTQEEWAQLIAYLGGENSAGGKLKATTLWKSPNKGATNESGFTAFPGGGRRTDGVFYFGDTTAFFWSASEMGYENQALSYSLGYEGPFISEIGFNKGLGFSVRCIKD